MIRLFANYSYAGYEELYLGKISDVEDFRYYLPMLMVKEDELNSKPDDEELKREVSRLQSYPAILRHGMNDEATLPSGSFTLVSKPGFKSIYRHLGSNYIFVISDIVGQDHDEMGGGKRRNPFTMLFVGDHEDCPLLNSLAFEAVNNDYQVRSVLGGLFSYDAKANGLRFSLGAIIEYLESLRDREIKGFNLSSDAPLIILSPGYSLKNTLESQELEGKSIGNVYDSEGKLVRGMPLSLLSLNNPQPSISDHDSLQGSVSVEDDSKEVIPEIEERKGTSDWKGKVKNDVQRIKKTYNGMTSDARKLFWGAILVSALIGMVTVSVTKCSHNTKSNDNNSVSRTLLK